MATKVLGYKLPVHCCSNNIGFQRLQMSYTP